MGRFAQFLTLFMVAVLSAHAIPAVLNYAGQVAVNGQPFNGQGLFKFALVNADGNATYWSNDGTSANDSEPVAHVSIPVNGGLYSLLLGNTAMSGMGAIDPQVFAEHSDAKLRVWFSDGVNGFQQLSPDRPFASVPYAFSAGTAQSVTIADGSINKSMLGSDVIADLNKTITITRDMLPTSVLNDLNKTVIITRNMLPQDVRDDLNKTVTITRSMLPADVLSDLNRTISKPMLGSDVIADLNATIGMDRLSAEVTAKLDQNGSGGSGVVAGSIISVLSGQSAPDGYSLYQRGEPKELVWEEKAPVSVAREAYDGVEVLDGKIYFVGGNDGSAKNIAERYDPATNTWESLNSMSVARHGVASAVLNGKLYAIGGFAIRGQRLSSVEIYDPLSPNWSLGIPLPKEISKATAIAFEDSLYLVNGSDSAGSYTNSFFRFNTENNSWSTLANAPFSGDGRKLVLFENKIWALGGYDSSDRVANVDSYDPSVNTWTSETSMTIARNWAVAWVANGKIYVSGGADNSSNYLNSIEVYNPMTKQWTLAGNFPENKYAADAVVLNDIVYVIAGRTSNTAYSNKVYAADLNASVEGVYDLYRKDGNASVGTPVVQAEVADGSVTASKMADGAVTANKMANNTITTSQLNEQILKYLKPEITAQPQAQTVFADSNASFSVTAAGKYLTYQWKKNGSNLTAETNATLTITDANATLHDGNYSVVVSNDFGSVESVLVTIQVSDAHMNGLVGWWKFDETNGTVAYDSSGNGNDGNLTNGPTWTTGKIGGALSFDGVDDFVQTPLKGRRNLDITWSLWIKTQTSNGGMIGVSGNTWLAGGQSFSIALGKPKIDACQVTYRTGSDLITTNAWTHCLFAVENNDSVKVFVNGNISIDSTVDWFRHDGTSFLMRIAHVPNQGEYYNGFIDDIRIYDRALSAAEVQALYNMGQ